MIDMIFLCLFLVKNNCVCEDKKELQRCFGLFVKDLARYAISNMLYITFYNLMNNQLFNNAPVNTYISYK